MYIDIFLVSLSDKCPTLTGFGMGLGNIENLWQFSPMDGKFSPFTYVVVLEIEHK